MDNINAEVAAFIRLCVKRRGDGWPELYDEMCRVASKKQYKRLGYTELSHLGLSLSLDALDQTAKMVDIAMRQDLSPV